MKKSLFWLLALVLSPVAVLVVITPMDSQKQYIFGLLSIGILFLMGFSKRRSEGYSEYQENPHHSQVRRR